MSTEEKKSSKYAPLDEALGDLPGGSPEGSKPLVIVTAAGKDEPLIVVDEEDEDEDEDETVTFETETAKQARIELEVKAKADADAATALAKAEADAAKAKSDADKAEAEASKAKAASEAARAAADAQRAKSESEKSAADLEKAKIEADAKAKADADAKTEADRVAAEARDELLGKLDKLVITIESRTTEGRFDLMDMPFDEKIARARGLLEELKPLLAEAEKLENLTPSEKKLIEDATTDREALIAVITHLKPSIESMPTMAQPSTPPPEPSHGAGEVLMPPPGAMSAPIPETRKSGSPPPLPKAEGSSKVETESEASQKPRVSEPSVIISADISDDDDGLPALEDDMHSDEGIFPVMKIGSAPKPENDYVIDHPSVSRRHAKLTLLSDGTLRIEDLKSTNGTFHSSADGLKRIAIAVVKVGDILRFGMFEVVISKNADDGKIYLEVTDSQPTGHTSAFEARSEEEALMHREEQARLNAMEEEVIEAAETSLRDGQRPLRPVTSFHNETASGGPPARKWGMPVLVGTVALAAVILLGFGLHWAANTLHPNPTTVAETDTTVPTPTETPTEVPTDSSSIIETPASGYNCHSVTADASCHTVASFLLTRGAGSPYWDCAGLNPDQARGMFRVEDPTATHRRILADTCGCQLCEPL